MNYPNPRNVSPQPEYPQGQYPPQVSPQQAYPPTPGQYPPQSSSGPYMQSTYPPDPRKAQPQSTYRRRPPLSRFQIRLGSLGLLGCAAGIYLEISGQAKNPTATVILIGGGALVLVLFLLLPLFLRR